MLREVLSGELTLRSWLFLLLKPGSSRKYRDGNLRCCESCLITLVLVLAFVFLTLKYTVKLQFTVKQMLYAFPLVDIF